MGSAGRVVVQAPGHDPGRWWLPPVEYVEGPVAGGVRSLHELAFAASASGRDVELRGAVSREIVDELAAATGATVALPEVPRPPGSGDIVVIPEVLEPLGLSRLLWSEARPVLICLAPPGLVGWPLEDDWSPPDILTVEVAAVVAAARRALHRAAGLGLTTWTHMPHLARIAAEEGLECTSIGNGTPGPLPPPGEKAVDLAWLRGNRWAPLAERAVAGFAGSVDAIEELPHGEFLARLGRARTLLWPSRIEGHGRIVTEARLLGTVPVALDTNPFAVGLADELGSVVVPSLDGLAPAATALLADPGRLSALTGRARAAAALQLNWEGYVARVGAALDAVAAPAMADAAHAAAARGALGRAVSSALADRRARAERLERHAAALEADRDGVEAQRAMAAGRVAELEIAVAAGAAELTRLAGAVELLTAERDALTAETGRLDREIGVRDRLVAAQEERIVGLTGG
jgi:hypothetical protein